MDFDLRVAIDVLERTPGALRALLQNVVPEWARGTEGPETFSPFDNVGHLIDGEETDWIPRARLRHPQHVCGARQAIRGRGRGRRQIGLEVE